MRHIKQYLLVIAALMASAVPVMAAEVETARMTWVEIRDAVKAGSTTILIPTGGIEQNGPHLVTGKHDLIVSATTRRIAAALGNALVAPVVSYTPEGDLAKREGHTAYPGTVSIPPDVFENVLVAIGDSFASHGFTTIVFVGDSGPNQQPQQRAAARVQAAHAAQGVRALSAEAYYAKAGQQEWLVSQGETVETIGTHAGIRDTSELLAIAPDAVRVAQFGKSQGEANGDPTRASAERGEHLIKLKVDAAVAEIKAARAAPTTAEETLGTLEKIKRWFSN